MRHGSGGVAWLDSGRSDSGDAIPETLHVNANFCWLNLGLKNLVSGVRFANDFLKMNPSSPCSSTLRDTAPLHHSRVATTSSPKEAGAGRAVVVLLTIATILAMNSCSKPPADTGAAPDALPATNFPPAVTPPVTNTASENLLNGNWVRPDGGYVIEVRSAQAGGKLEAFYFNPNPINVSRAEWRREHDGLHVFIELRDQNYPGATYKLHYQPDKDQLAGEYFQPVYQQTFDVHFIRQSR